MVKKFFSILLVIAASFFFYECSEDPTSVGLNQIPSGDPASLKQATTDSLNQTSFFFKDSTTLAFSTRLILGEYKQAESSMLLRFLPSTVADSILTMIRQNTYVIKSAKVLMKADYFIGDKSMTIPFTAYKINNYWTATFNADSLSKLEPLSQAVSITGSLTRKDSLYSFDLSNDLVKEWLQAYADTATGKIYGIYLKDNLTSGQEAAVGFQVNSSVSEPITLQVIGQTSSGRPDTVDFKATQELHVVKQVSGSGLPTNSGYLYLQGGISIDAFLKFYFPTIPDNAVVNNAILELNYDSTQSAFGTPTPDQIIVNLSTAFDSLNIAKYDSITGSASLTKTSLNKYTGDITKFVNEWFQKNATTHFSNRGLKLSLFDKMNTVDFLAIISSENPVKSLRPRIKIIYSVP